MESEKQNITKQVRHRPNASTQEKLLEKNNYISLCPDVVQEALRSLYRSMNPHSVSKKGVRELTERIMPLSGFYKGCVYAHDPYRQLLIPRVSVGISNLCHYNNIDLSPIAVGIDPVAVAFHASTPIVTENFWGNTQCVAIAAVYGTVQRPGVLYLESSSELFKNKDFDPLSIFQALNQTLKDSLKIQ